MSLDDLDRIHLGAYKSYSDRDARLDRRRGALDAAKALPSATGQHFPFRDQIVAQSQRDLTSYEIALRAYESKKRQTLTALNQQCDQEYPSRLADLQQQQRDKLIELDTTKGTKASVFIQAFDNKEQAEKTHQRLMLKLQRPLRVTFLNAYIPLMILLAVLEVPVNRPAFELFFQEIPIMSIAICAMLGAVLLLFAHFLGTWLTQGPNHDSRWARVWRLAFGVLIVVVVAVIIFGLAKLRQGYIQLIEGQQAQSFGSLLEGRLSELALASWTAPLDLAGYTLLFVNLAIVLLGTILAFVRHDPDPDYEKATQTLKRASRRLSRYQTRYEQAVAIAKRTYDDQISRLNRQNDHDEERRKKLLIEIAHIHDRHLHSKLMVLRTLRQRLANYQIGNQEARTDEKVPECFRPASEESTADLALAGTFDWLDGLDGHSSRS